MITPAFERVCAGGGTNGADGIRLAYAIAEQAHIKAGINCIILTTDGDYNVGTIGFDALKDRSIKKATRHIADEPPLWHGEL